MNRTALGIALFGVVIAAIAKALEDFGADVATWFVYTGFAITAAGLIYEFHVGKPFAVDFTAADWNWDEERKGYVVVVRRTRHKKGLSPTATTYLRSNGRLEEVIADVHVTNGDLIIVASQPFAGAVIVK